MRKLKQGPVEQFNKKCRLRNQTSKVEQFRRRKYRQRNHRTSEEEVRKRKNHKELRNKNMWRLFQQLKKRYPRYSPWKQNYRLSQWRRRSKHKDKNTSQNCRTRGGYITISCCIGGDYRVCRNGDKCLEGYDILSFHFLSFYKDFGDGLQSTKGVMLRGQDEYTVWMNKAFG